MYTTKEIGSLIRDLRKKQGLSQQDLALVSGTGVRFIGELEKGKESCHLGKALTVLQTLGVKLELRQPRMEIE